MKKDSFYFTANEQGVSCNHFPNNISQESLYDICGKVNEDECPQETIPFGTDSIISQKNLQRYLSSIIETTEEKIEYGESERNWLNAHGFSSF